MRKDIKIIVYSANYCSECRMVKQYMDNIGIDYEVRDISNKEYMDELTEKGIKTIPVLRVDDTFIVISNNIKEIINEL